MIALLVMLASGVAQCQAEPALVAAATERAAVFDLRARGPRLQATYRGAPRSWCPTGTLRGLIAAREAYSHGGSPESLEPVKLAMEQLASRAAETRAAGVAPVVLMAASAASQSEREEMGLLLEHASNLERQQRSAGLHGGADHYGAGSGR